MQSGASWAAILVMSCACGRIGFAPGSDAAMSGDVDARDDAGMIDAPCTAPFMTPSLVTATATAAHEWGGALSADGLELYFGSDRGGGGGGFDIYRSTRASHSAAFGMPALVSEVATGANEDNPFLTSDGLELWFDRAGEIMRATRVDLQSAWQAPQPVAEINSGANDVAAMVRDDLLAVYFASDRTPSSGNIDLYIATRATIGDAFGAPVSLSTINTPSFDCCPHVGERGAQLLFTTYSLVPGNTIGVVALDAMGLPTGPVSPAQLDDVGEEIDVFETPDGKLRGYSYRAMQGTGDFDLYLMERSCP